MLAVSSGHLELAVQLLSHGVRVTAVEKVTFFNLKLALY